MGDSLNALLRAYPNGHSAKGQVAKLVFRLFALTAVTYGDFVSDKHKAYSCRPRWVRGPMG